jgi:DNA (cytosine-5)-methyltransferase 1
VLLGCFRDLGYSVEWRVVNAADYGFPQKRRRIFIFAFRDDTVYHKKVKSESLSSWLYQSGFFGKAFPVEEMVTLDLGFESEGLHGDIAEISADFAYGFENAGIMTQGRIYTTRVEPVYSDPCPLGSILAKKVDEKYRIKDKDMDEWTYMKGAKRELRRTKAGFEYNYAEGAIPFPDPLDKPGRTMLTSEGTKNRSTHVVRDPETHRLRLLTPIECERMNGFNDDWTNTGMPESFRYFCMGNALVVGLIDKIGAELAAIVKRER